MKITIKDKCPSWNKLYAGLHWTKRKKMADDIHELVYWAVYESKNKPKVLPYKNPVFLEYEVRYKGKRRHDADNCAVKMYCDGLVHSGILAEDDYEHVVGYSVMIFIGQDEDSVTINIKEV